MYRVVLLAFDGSLEGRIALREGARLAQICRAKVFLLSVVTLPSGIDMAEGAFSGILDHQQSEYEAILREGVERLEAMGFATEARLAFGDAVVQIGAVAREIGADLVVIGHRRRAGLARWWFGSVGTRIADEIHCSVLIGRHDIGDAEFVAMMASGPSGR